ncbi:MAG: hypothetical protein ABIJ15_02200 [bacterium]
MFCLLVAVHYLCPFLQAEALRIEAEKMIYLKQGDIVEFKKSVKFSKEGFNGISETLLLDKKQRDISAAGNVYIILKSTTTAQMLKLWTKEILYNEKSDKISSSSPAKFLVFTSTGPRPDAAGGSGDKLAARTSTPEKSGVYEITCDSFYGFAAGRMFYLSGKPVIINGEGREGRADFADFSNDVIMMKENASMDYKGEKPYFISAGLIRIDTASGKINFKENVEGTFYNSNPQ